MAFIVLIQHMLIKAPHKIIGEWLYKKYHYPKIYSKIPKLNNTNIENKINF